jgi:methionyl aminopeptidase
MTIETDKDIIGLMNAGRVVGLALRAMQAAVRPGMTTRELDAVGAAVLKEHGARSAPIITYKYPAVTCISIDDEATHGIPGERVIQEGDLVKIDVSAELDGYFADSHLTVPVGAISPAKQKLIDCARATFESAIDAAKAGRPISDIGRAAESTARHFGLNVIPELSGHGVGRGLHESPTVPNVYMRRANSPLREGMVIAIEPHVTAGKGRLVTAPDGWTAKTRDGKPVASFEHTVVITDDRPLLLTAV